MLTQAQKKIGLRKHMRSKRRSLSLYKQKSATAQLSLRIQKISAFKKAASVGFYLANDGEISPSGILTRALSLGKVCYLPALTSSTEMEFRQFTDRRELVANRFGILEPCRRNRVLSAIKLDVVFFL